MAFLSNFDITSANAQLVLTVEDLYPQGVVLEMFGTDQALGADSFEFVEARKGVDGRLVAGVVNNPISVNITLESASPSLPVMETIRDAQISNKRPYICNLVVSLPAIGQTKIFKRGVLRGGSTIANVGKTLQPTNWQFVFESVE